MFENDVKEEILIDKLRSLVAGSAMVSDAEIRQKFEKDNTKIKFDYAVLHKDDILKGLHPSDLELKAFYDRNKATYNNSIPEKRKIKYVLIDTAKLQGEQQVSQQDLQK
jgi:peptidyl-prolyl cis-trans isomerase D